MKRLFLSYESLISNLGAEAERIAKFIGLEAQPDLGETVASDMRHQRIPLDQMLARSDVSLDAKTMYCLLERLDINGNDSPLIDSIFRGYEGVPSQKQPLRSYAGRAWRKFMSEFNG